MPAPSRPAEIEAILRSHTVLRGIPCTAALTDALIPLSRAMIAREAKKGTTEMDAFPATTTESESPPQNHYGFQSPPLSGARVAECCRNAAMMVLREDIRGRERRVGRGRTVIGEEGKKDETSRVMLDARHLWQSARQMELV